MALTPYVVGQWVRAERFYGREELLREILDGHRNCLWILGTRRIGKTSVLKQVEHLAAQEETPRYLPLFWDFQGAEDSRDLDEGFADALLDAAGRLDRLGIDLDDVEADDLFTSLGRLRRELRSRGLVLLLLGDEVEELVNIDSRDPRFLRRLGRALQSTEGIRTVFASTIRLWTLADEDSSSGSFLQGFTPPLAIRGLDAEAARDLVRQSHLPPSSRPELGEEAVERICDQCSNHPYLLQLLGERLLERGDLEAAIEEIANDQMVRFFFGSDLGMLGDGERTILRVIHDEGEVSSRTISERLHVESGTLAVGLHRLEHLGFVARSEGGFRLVNPFFSRWFGELSVEPLLRPSGTGPSTVRMEATDRPPSAAGERRIDGRYDLVELLGSGASGQVFKARDRLLETHVALKLLKLEYSADVEAIERLRREVLLSRELSHPHVLKVFHLGSDEDRHYITMQLVEGADLGQLLRTEGRLEPGRAITIGRKLASALATLHRRRVLHRDLKPSNVLMDLAGEPLLTDFGLARLTTAPGITQEGMFLGTPAYASPEQIAGRPLDERSDLYAFGVMLFEMTTGRRPFANESMLDLLRAHLEAPPPDPAALAPGLPAELCQLILRCLAKEPSARVPSARALEDELRSFGS